MKIIPPTRAIKVGKKHHIEHIVFPWTSICMIGTPINANEDEYVLLSELNTDDVCMNCTKHFIIED